MTNETQKKISFTSDWEFLKRILKETGFTKEEIYKLKPGQSIEHGRFGSANYMCLRSDSDGFTVNGTKRGNDFSFSALRYEKGHFTVIGYNLDSPDDLLRRIGAHRLIQQLANATFPTPPMAE
jgi:hypothetical protein